jgi:hypothetical protein
MEMLALAGALMFAPEPGVQMKAKNYKFQAYVTVNPAGHGGPATVPPGQVRRMAVRGEHHDTHGSRFFSALVANSGEGSGWLDEDHEIVTVALRCEDPGHYFCAGDHFALWLGDDVADGVVTRRVFF